jgi:hypothetical protein
MAGSQVAVSGMSFADRLGEVLRRSLPRLGPEARKQIEAILSPESLLIIAAVLSAWVVSHAFGLGEVIDAILLAVGAIALGWAFFEGIDHLYEFAKGTYFAASSADLDRAAEHFAKAVSILGVQAVLAVLFKGGKAPKTGRGGRMSGGTGPRGPGVRYKPKVTQDPTLPAGHGSTSAWGDIRVSTQGSATDRALVLLHEQVHQFLTPKLYFLRNYRVSNMSQSYVRSSLWRYIEEALAETIAQVGVNGFKNFFQGIKFPLGNGYAHLTRGGGYNPAFGGSGVLVEAAGLLYQGVVSGISFHLYFQPNQPAAYPAEQ